MSILIILLLFKKVNISGFRKLVYFVVGAAVTCILNIFRVAAYFFILYDTFESSELAVAETYRDVYADLFSVVWILSYMLLIVCIEKFGLAEKAMQKLRGSRVFLRLTKKEALDD